MADSVRKSPTTAFKHSGTSVERHEITLQTSMCDGREENHAGKAWRWHLICYYKRNGLRTSRQPVMVVPVPRDRRKQVSESYDERKGKIC
jgi:hypothetical protein